MDTSTKIFTEVQMSLMRKALADLYNSELRKAKKRRGTRPSEDAMLLASIGALYCHFGGSMSNTKQKGQS